MSHLHPEADASPFCARDWRDAAAQLRSVRMLALTAIFIALRVVVSSFSIPLGGNLHIFFGYFVAALGGAVYGPVLGLLSGFGSDLLGYALHPTGPYFPGYTLTTMLASCVYALCFYRRRITALRILGCKLFVNLVINVGLGSLWSAMLYGKGYYFYLARGLVKNLTLLPVEVLLLYWFFRAILPQTHRMGLTREKSVSFC